MMGKAKMADGSVVRFVNSLRLREFAAKWEYYNFILAKILKKELRPGRMICRVKCVFSKRNRRLEELLNKRPFSLNIETINICNARCYFCAYPKKTNRKKEEMSLELYEKIIREYSEMGGGTLDFSPINGDFFLDSKCLERIEIARRYPKIGTITVVTNGIALDRIKDSWNYFINNTDIMHFSIGGLTRESYHKMYGVDKYEKVKSNIVNFAKLRNRIRPEYVLGLILRVAKKSEVFKSPDFKEFKKLGIDIMIDNVYSNWGGTVGEEDLPAGAILRENIPLQAKLNPCFVFYIGLGITSSGLAVACSCMNEEISPELTIGDCTKESLEEIWNSERYKKIKSSFGTGNLPEICKRCTHYMDGVKYSLTPDVLNFKEGRYPFGY